MIGTEEISNYLLGSSQVRKLYKGADLVWENGGGTPVFVQSAKVMFTANGQFRSDTNWNTIDESATNIALSNNTGIVNGWEISVSGNDWDIDDAVSNSGLGDFSSIALQRLVYTFNTGAVKIISFTSLDSTKKYKLRFAGLAGYDDPTGDATNRITVNGVTKDLALPLGFTGYEVSFDVTGLSTMTATLSPLPGNTYAAVCAAILEEYSTT